MKLKSFQGEAVHGFLDIKIRFKPNITFLVGINGSGKTTALEAIYDLITPSFQNLSKMRFDRIRVDFSNYGENGFVESLQEENSIIIRSSSTDEEVRFARYVSDPDSPSYKEFEHEQEYYRDLASKMAQHPVVSFINSLPTPMFLGLSRRGGGTGNDRVVGGAWERTRIRRNIFSGSLTQGVREAIALAETRHRDALIAVGRLGDKLRRDMLLELLTVERRDGWRLTPPSEADLKRIPDMRKGIDGLSKILGLPNFEVSEKIGTFLDVLEESSREIPKGKNLEAMVKDLDEDESQKVISALINWSVHAPELNRIKKLSEMVAQHNKDTAKITADNDRYLKLLSRFLEDGRKEITFDDRGYISISLVDGENKFPISSLSSGESQIFVILTHLLFNPKAEKDNVFIIDEPELSLHIQWQELFVESIVSANPHVQYIMATHSPSIILDRDKDCVDVVAKANSKAVRSRAS